VYRREIQLMGVLLEKEKIFKADIEKVEQGVAPDRPTMGMSMIWEGLSRALQGVAQPPEQPHIEGELKATKYHLEDLRKLLKLEI